MKPDFPIHYRETTFPPLMIGHYEYNDYSCTA